MTFSLPPVDLATAAKVVGLTSANVFCGYVWCLSRSSVPAILQHGSGDEAEALSQWRHVFVDGGDISKIASVASALSFGYLAYEAPDLVTRGFFAASAFLGASGILYAQTLLRRTNGALSIRAQRLIGPVVRHVEGEGEGEDKPQPMAQPIYVTYSVREARSIARESDPAWTTTRLVRRWQFHNYVRLVILAAGAVAATCGVVLRV